MKPAGVLLEIREGVAWLTLNRPGHGNAIDIPLARTLIDAAIRCDIDSQIRCVVLRAEGRMFCAGGDIEGFVAADGAASAFVGELASLVHIAVARLARMRKPLLVLVNGPAAGAGLSLAIAGDVVLATPSAHFTAAYTAIGLTPDGGMTWLLPRLIGLRKAREMILTNRRIGAAEAEAIGLVTRLVDDGALEAEGRRVAEELARSAVGALGVARELLLDSFSNSLETHLGLEARNIAAAAGGPESKEGLAAFAGKRPADFRGASQA